MVNILILIQMYEKKMNITLKRPVLYYKHIVKFIHNINIPFDCDKRLILLNQ